MYLYHLTLQKPNVITHVQSGNFSVEGNFTTVKEKELLIARGRILELYRLDTDIGRLISVFSQEVFGVIRSMMPFRFTGSKKDFIIIGSDSGKISILEFDKKTTRFIKVHEETFGRSGCRRIVPGQYLAVDPKARAIMIGAIEKQKFVYIINRDSSTRLTISSPLEAHKSRTLCFSMVGIDVGYNNPIFACIEVDYQAGVGNDGEIDKQVVFYELDLGLNHVVRHWTSPIDPTANMLITVPGDKDGPSGVLVCAENFLYWKNQDHNDVHAALPRRSDMDDARGLLIVSHCLFQRRGLFFFLLQSEMGDLYKVDLIVDPASPSQVTRIRIAYFDTVPLSLSLSVILPGYLFCAAESGNHVLFQIVSTGDDMEVEKSEEIESDEDFIKFQPHPLKNLEVFEQMESMSPILQMDIRDLLKEATPQMYALSGSNATSSLRVLRHGLEVTEMAVTELPGNPSAVWTVKKARADLYSSYIVISFMDATLVLSIDQTVEEVSEQDSGFVGGAPTLHCCQLGEDGIVQIIPSSIRYISKDLRVHEWRTPGKKQIIHASSNQHQIVVSLTGGELYFFQLDASSGQLVELAKKEMGFEISCIDLAPIPEGRVSGALLAVGDWENTVRILTLEQGRDSEALQTLTMQSLPSQPVALCLLPVLNTGTLYLHVGQQDGVLLRMQIDQSSGELSDVRRRFLGVKPVKLVRLTVEGQQSAMIALSSRSWMAYQHQGRFHLTPLSYQPLEGACPFQSEQVPDGIVSISQNTLRVLAVEKLGNVFNQTEVPLKYTPRQFVVHNAPNSNNTSNNHLIIIESEHNVVSSSPSSVPHYLYPGTVTVKVEDAENGEGESAPIRWLLRPKAGVGKWASCIRVLNPATNNTVDFKELENNEAAFSISIVSFHERKGETFVVVGTGKDVELAPRKSDGGFIHVYKLLTQEDASGETSVRLELVHKTKVEEIPLAVCGFQGRLLVGLGNTLRIYDLGKRKLLRKCENKGFPKLIRSIQTQGDRIIVGDIAESFHYVKYKRFENQLFIFADDTAPRWVTAAALLDYDTVAGGDKFGNVFVCRLPKEVSEDVEDDPTAAHLQHVITHKGAPHKLTEIIQFHVGEPITHISRASLVPGGASILIYTTIHGAIGALVPFVSREDVDLFSKLEMHLRQDFPPLCGRDHMAYRSYYYPVKNVIDGDLCEQINLLDSDKQNALAEELNKPLGEVLKKLEDMRNRCL